MKIFLLVIFSFLNRNLYSQTTAEWFNQKKTQIEYLVRQIAMLEKHTTDVKKGYKIAKEGLGWIRDAKNGDFDQHRNYFTSLQTISQAVKKYHKLFEILELETATSSHCKKLRSVLEGNAHLNPSEINTIHAVYQKLTEKRLDIIDELLAVTTDNRLKLTDAERISRIDKLYQESKARYNFIRSVSSNTISLANARKKEKMSIEFNRKIHNLKNQ